MALSAQPSEWSVDTGITHNIENIAIFRGIHDEVKDIVVHMDHIDDKVRGRVCTCRGVCWYVPMCLTSNVFSIRSPQRTDIL